MRIGVFHGSAYYLRYYRTALEPLLERGHELVLARAESKERVVVPRRLAEAGTVSTAFFPKSRDDGLERTIRLLRLARDVVRYASPPLSEAYANRRRALRKLVQALSDGERELPRDADLPEALHALGESLSPAFRDLERLLPPNERLVRFLDEQRLDAAVCVSRINFGGPEPDVVNAARALGIPSAIVVYSWDNLSSKALVHEQPDRLFVWNDRQVREAVQLHGLDPAAVVATGAPRFDGFFALEPPASREEALRTLELDPARATILYLGSSGFVSKQEPAFVDEWARALRSSADERLRHANVIVRPHPGTLDEPAWGEWRPDGERVALPMVRRKDRQLFEHVWASDAVVALNTSAEIEAAIVGRPVLTIDAGGLAPGQEGSTHFRYLLAKHGGFVEEAGSLTEHLEQLARALRDDPHAEARTRFLESFVRPRGLDRDAGPELASEIEALAGRAAASPLAGRAS